MFSNPHRDYEARRARERASATMNAKLCMLDEKIKKAAQAKIDFNSAIENHSFIQAWGILQWHGVETPDIAYKLAECMLNDIDFIECDSLGFESIEKSQLLFLLLRFIHEEDKEHQLLIRALNFLSLPEVNFNGPSWEDALKRKKVCPYSERKTLANEVYYESIALNPALLLEQTNEHTETLTEAFNTLKLNLFRKMTHLNTIICAFPNEGSYDNMMKRSCAKAFIDTHTLLTRSETTLFSSSRINETSTLEALLMNAKRTDNPRSRGVVLNLGWFNENNGQLELTANAPKPVKDTWLQLRDTQPEQSKSQCIVM